MHARFFVPDIAPGRPVALPLDEAEHVTRVLRLRAGDTIAVFDGRGHEYLADIKSARRGEVVVQTTAPVVAAAEPSVPVTLAVAVTRGDRMDGAVRDGAMLGVAVVQPILTAHTETTAPALARANRVERWTRVAVASVKQCGRAVVPEIREPLSFSDYLAVENADMRFLFVEPRAGAASALTAASKPDSAAIAIGPEGGWTEEEIVAACRSGFHAVTLGQRTLRADAMPIAAIVVLQFMWGDL